jgi:hypothetical protein
MKSTAKTALFCALVALALVVVVLLCAAFARAAGGGGRPRWAHLGYWKALCVESPDQVYERSAGGFDEAAALALRRSAGRRRPAVADHLRAATIIHRNILSQEEPRLARGGAPPAEAARAARAARLWRREMFGEARRHHLAALGGLTARAVERDEGARAARRFAPPGRGQGGAAARERAPPPPRRGETPGQPGAADVIDAAVRFAVEGLAALLENDPALAAAGGPAGGGFLAFQEAFRPEPDGEMLARAQDRRLQAIQSRRAAAAEVAAGQGGGAGARAEAYLDLSQRHTSDPQNSHDSGVNAAKRAIVARLRAEQGGGELLPTLDEIAAELRRLGGDFSRDPRTAQPRPELVEKALAVVDRARGGERSAAARASDAEVLRRVWARADDPRNAGARSAMRQAAFDALVGAWEPGLGGEQIQCVDGRISRLVGSLATLDCDPRNGHVARLEHHKNEIFALAAAEIRAAAAAAAEQDDEPALRDVGRAYLAETQAELQSIGALDEEAERAWTGAARARVERAIDARLAEIERTSPGAFSGPAAESVKTEALAALEA